MGTGCRSQMRCCSRTLAAGTGRSPRAAGVTGAGEHRRARAQPVDGRFESTVRHQELISCGSLVRGLVQDGGRGPLDVDDRAAHCTEALARAASIEWRRRRRLCAPRWGPCCLLSEQKALDGRSRQARMETPAATASHHLLIGSRHVARWKALHERKVAVGQREEDGRAPSGRIARSEAVSLLGHVSARFNFRVR